MTSTQRFEGPSLEDLLEQVRQEMGPEVTIIEANRLRRGGIAGFFAKERFEVVADHLDGAEAADPGPADPGPEVGTSAAARPLRTRPLVAPDDLVDDDLASDEPVDDRSLLDGPGAPTSLLDLVRAASDAEQHQSSPAGAVPAGMSAPASHTTPSTEGPSFATVLGDVARNAGLTFDAAPDSLIDAPVPTVPASVPARTPRARVRAAHPDAADRVGALDVVRLGFPPVALTGSGTPMEQLLSWLASLPAPPSLPSCRGAVVAIAGPRRAAMDLARRLAVEAGVDPDEVVLASSDRRCTGTGADDVVRDADQARELRRSWRRRQQTTFVVVDAPLRGAGAAWAAEVLDALEPTVLWGSVSADRKVEDVNAWLDIIGDVDALDVRDLDDTLTPASVLSTGAVVGRLEGAPATPRRWLALAGVELPAGVCAA